MAGKFPRGLLEAARRIGFDGNSREAYRYEAWWTWYDERIMREQNIQCAVCGTRIIDRPAHRLYSRTAGTRNDDRRECWICKDCRLGPH